MEAFVKKSPVYMPGVKSEALMTIKTRKQSQVKGKPHVWSFHDLANIVNNI